MFLSILDLILLVIMCLFVAFGFFVGLIEALGSIVGLFLGVWLGGIFYKDVGDGIAKYVFNQQNLAYVVSFVVIYAVVTKLVGFLFYIISKVYKLFTIIPFLKTINRVAGALLGLIESALILGVTLIFLAQFPFSSWLTRELGHSQIALWLMAVAKVLTPLLPKIFVSINPIQ